MPLRKIIRLKEFVKDSRVRELKEVNMQIEALKEEVRLLDLKAESINEELKVSFSHSLLIRYKAIMAKKKELTERIRQLELLKVEKRERLKEAYRDLKALEILRINKERENIRKNLNIEFQRMGFIHLIRRRQKNA
ncbi:hypothetical protein IAE16_08280 [Hydrogenobacter sp. T-2]|uniref:hypothetical protein n=1 Tax=Pampinifervens diazotrophicum TaxID=1632018 RepID=UPI002B25BB34|nr:hypothetical protein [Hydrogenobacter sp. T-2]WPM31809.1 hypothetical protein IAE16_08280 [Hydrogenobacter sp. T-2]